MSEFSKFPNKLFEVTEFLNLNQAPDSLLKSVMDIKNAIANGDYSTAAKIINSNKAQLENFLIDSKYINYLDEELCELEKYVQGSGQQMYYTLEQPQCNENDSWIQNANLVDLPVAVGELRYTGVQQSPSWENYDSNYLLMEGNYVATNSGTYNVAFTPINGAKWRDTLTSEQRLTTWKIWPAKGHIDVEPSGLIILVSLESVETVTYTTNNGDAIVYTDDTENINVETGPNNTIVVSRKSREGGDYSFTIVSGPDRNHTQCVLEVPVICLYDSTVVIDAVPTQEGSLYYDGSTQVPTWNGFEESALELTLTPQTNPGTYTATFTPRQYCKWWDDTTDPKTATWTIQKGISSIVFDQSSVVLTNSYIRTTIGYTHVGGTVVCEYPPTGVEVQIQSENIVLLLTNTITEEYGLAITFTIPGSDYYTGTSSRINVRFIPNGRVIQNVPEQAEPLVYDPEIGVQSPVWRNYNSSALTLGGVYEGTNAGTYTATFKPKSNYTWTDGSTRTVSVDWTIYKANGWVDLNKYSVTVGMPYSDSLIVNEATGDISLEYDSTKIIATYSGSTITINAVTEIADSTTLRIVADESDNYYSYSIGIPVTINGDVLITDLPGQAQGLVYDGTSKSPTWDYYGFEDYLTIVGGTTSAINAGTYYVQFRPKSGSRWFDGTKEIKNVGWILSKAPSTITFSPESITLLYGEEYKDVTVTVSGSNGALSFTPNQYLSITSLGSNKYRFRSMADRNEIIDVKFTVEADSNHSSATAYLRVYLGQAPKIYGAQWYNQQSGASTKWTRTDDAVGLLDPDPVNETSPFDNIAPWSGMELVAHTGSYLVKIPKYYFSLEPYVASTGMGINLRISDTEFEGSHISPAHADRGDGAGVRENVYVGAYHCNDSYKSVAGASVAKSKTRAQFRSLIHNIGSGFYQWDYAMYWTIMMLYLVEFADWDAQSNIGTGYMNGASYADPTGRTSSLTYHTGNINGHVRYRYIEDLWGAMRSFVDGIYLNGTSVYVIHNPDNFSDTENGTYIGTRYKRTSSEDPGIIYSYTIPSVEGYEYALIPSNAVDQTGQYTTDLFYLINSTSVTVTISNGYQVGDTDEKFGPFSFGGTSASSSSTTITSRLMYLP